MGVTIVVEKAISTDEGEGVSLTSSRRSSLPQQALLSRSSPSLMDLPSLVASCSEDEDEPLPALEILPHWEGGSLLATIVEEGFGFTKKTVERSQSAPVPRTTTTPTIEDEDVLSVVESVELPTPPLWLDQWTESMLECVACTPKAPPKTRPPSALRTSSSRLSQQSPPSRQVSFGSMEIREFPLTLGHHPSAATSGPPVALDWNQASMRVHSVEEYERARQPRRHRKQLKLRGKERHELLLQHFSETEVLQAWSEALEIRQQRQETMNRSVMAMVYDDAVESMGRKFRRFSDNVSQVLTGSA